VSGAEACVTWELEFYCEERHALVRYEVQAPTPAAAQALGRKALLSEHRPPAPRRRARSLFEQAQRVGGRDADGWVLYRIGRAADATKPATK
jgi:hypothetical protein